MGCQDRSCEYHVTSSPDPQERRGRGLAKGSDIIWHPMTSIVSHTHCLTRVGVWTGASWSRSIGGNSTPCALRSSQTSATVSN